MLLFFGQKVARISVFLISNYLLFLCKKTQTCLCYTVLAICMFIFCYCPSYTYLPTYTRAITIIIVTLIIGVMLCKHCTGSQTHDKRIQKNSSQLTIFVLKNDHKNNWHSLWILLNEKYTKMNVWSTTILNLSNNNLWSAEIIRKKVGQAENVIWKNIHGQSLCLYVLIILPH